jgi:hypothetical protein
MPYILLVLSFIVVGVGFTLFSTESRSVTSVQTQELPIEESIDKEIAAATSTFKEKIDQLLADSDDSTPVTESIPEPNIPTPTPTTPAPVTPKPTSNPTPVATPAPAPDTTYKNGTYSSQANYRTPDGSYSITVAMTIANDIVSNSTVTFDAKGARDSYSKRFLSSYGSKVTGSDLSNVSLSRVGGASLTTNAFNNAVNSIKKQAAS